MALHYATKMRQIQCVLASVILLMSTACTIKTLYDHLDMLIPFYLQGMVSLDDQLELKVEQRSVVFMSWHRYTQLNRYADWLQSIKNNIENGAKKQQIKNALDAIKSFWDALLLKMNEEMVLLLPLLDSNQRTELYASVREKNEEFREEYIAINDAERIENYAELMQDIYDNWLGDLTEIQELQIQRAASQIESSALLRLQRRLQWQENLKRILDSNESNLAKSQKLRAFFKSFDLYKDPEIESLIFHNKRILVDLTYTVLQQMNPDQKTYLLEKFDDTIRMLNDLSGYHVRPIAGKVKSAND